MSNVTYRRLEDALRELGFTYRGLFEQNKVFLHELTGAVVTFPDFPLDQEVHPHNFEAIRAILKGYGLADPVEFIAKLQLAS
jgi:hypothetical protein